MTISGICMPKTVIMHKVFVDTNIIFEHALKREHYRECVQLFKLAEDGKIECWCSSAGYYVFSYVLRKQFTVTQTRVKLRGYLSFLDILPCSTQNIQAAIISPFKDLEDAFQYYTALNRVDSFVTLNKKDFEKYSLPELEVFTPAEFMESVK